MKIELPLETWADLLPHVPRQQLVQIVKQLGDRQFAKILIFFLTEVGQIQLAHLTILAPRENDAISGPIVEVRYQLPAILSEWDQWELPFCDLLETNLAEGPMPNNVKDFKIIELRYFDTSVANFLRQFQREQEEGNSLLDNVNLWFYPYLSISPRDDGNNTLMHIIAQIMPTIGNINSIHMCHFELHDFEGVNNYAQPLKEMLTKTRVLDMDSIDRNSVFSFREWLHTPRTDGKPRALRLLLSAPNTVKFTEDIKKDFSKATRPVSFFVYVRVYVARGVDWQDGCLDNACTNERLAIETFGPRLGWCTYDAVKLKISRYPMDATREWIEANERKLWSGSSGPKIDASDLKVSLKMLTICGE